MNFKFDDAKQASGHLVTGLFEEGELTGFLGTVNQKTNGRIETSLKQADFSGKKGKTIQIHALDEAGIHSLIIIGLGKKDDLSDVDLQHAGGNAIKFTNAKKLDQVGVYFDGLSNSQASHIAFGMELGNYHFNNYFTTDSPNKRFACKDITFYADQPKALEEESQDLLKIAQSIYLCRDLNAEPPNVLYPKSYADRVKKLESVGLEVEILGEKELEKLGMHTLLGVGQGSAKESQVVVMKWNGNPSSKEAPVAFIGKGVTFDTGGISLKPAGGMEDMKWDMGGSATVVGVMHALASRQAKVNAVGVIGLVENMPSSNAQRPSDVVKSMSGQTVEVINTDAEGRLLLADILWFAQERFNPKFMIDLATLTGAMIVALGHVYAGYFSSCDKLSEELMDVSSETDERVWRLPLDKDYDRMINSDIADMKNVGTPDRSAGSIVAAQFLHRFTNKVPWIHLDIAGVTWTTKEMPTKPKGATGFGVYLLNKLVEKYYEDK